MKAALLLYFLILQATAFSQELLANGGFEDVNTCTEFQRECAPEAWINSSLINNYYFEDLRHAAAGVHFCSVITGCIYERKKDYHSFLYSRLLCALRRDHHYRVSFMAWSKHEAFDSLGVYFSAGDFLFEKRTYKQLIPALLVHDSAGDMASPNKWRQFSFDYTATGDENYFVLGNFKRRPFELSLPDDDDGNFYVFIDQVSMQPLDPHELICKSADSMKTAIYDENDRHNLLEKRRAIYKNAPPPVVKAPPTIEQHIDTLLIPDILFATGSARLTVGSHHVLDSFCTALARRPSDSLVIEGHTDSVGSLQYNFRLSADRANAVEQYLRKMMDGGIPKTIVRYYAYMKPVASNRTPEGRTRNRRVELFLYRHEL
ncbi:MAG TPA: OmpA family protein [Chitinophagaceae bacterium]|jgi:outer membrane protein OmpA-like peptidoglycan-associated protein